MYKRLTPSEPNQYALTYYGALKYKLKLFDTPCGFVNQKMPLEYVEVVSALYRTAPNPPLFRNPKNARDTVPVKRTRIPLNTGISTRSAHSTLATEW